MNFNIGDKVVEISSGDIGVVQRIEPTAYCKNAHYIHWQTGLEAGSTLWLRPEEIKLYIEIDVDLVGQTIEIAGRTYKLARP